jgi:hypothetical protein
MSAIQYLGGPFCHVTSASEIIEYLGASARELRVQAVR